MSRSERRLERIKEEIDIVDLLADYGYAVLRGGGYREQQFSCDLHGDGFDGKPSARVYPESQSWYCFACDKTRDAVETVREKNGVGFMEAMKLLETRYGLPDLPWEEGDYSTKPKPMMNPVEEYLAHTKSFEEERKQAWVFLTEVTRDRELSMHDTLGFWEAFDMLCYREKNGMEEAKVAVGMASLRKRVIKKAIEQQKLS